MIQTIVSVFDPIVRKKKMADTMVEDFYRNLPRLETTRLILRQAAISDVLDIAIYSSDSEVTQFLRWGPHKTLAETENYIKGVLAEYREGRDGPWVIESKENHSVLGHIHLMEISSQHRKAQVGFVLSKAYWNQGIMTEALKAVLKYSFDDLGLNRIEGLCIRENQAAKRVLEKTGMIPEGELRQYLFQKGRYWDFSLYAILRQQI
jgi:[ribosomal protein S5]-alanine N-acetyltransferase